MDDIQNEVRSLLQKIGEDPEREGLIKTPERVHRSWEFLTRGYRQNLDEVVHGAIFEEDVDDMVIVREAKGINCLVSVLREFGDVVVVAPHTGRSPTSSVSSISSSSENAAFSTSCCIGTSTLRSSSRYSISEILLI